MTKNKGGRPTIMTPDVILKLEEAFKIGCTDLEACFNADISKEALYNYQKKNPEFKERKQALKESPTFMARTSVVQGLQNDPHLALKYLERKKKKEFGLKTDVDFNGNIDTNLNVSFVPGNAKKSDS